MTDTRETFKEDQGLGEFPSLGEIVASTLKVRGSAPERGPDAAARPSKAGAAERQERPVTKSRKRKRRKKVGGWRTLTGIPVRDVGEALQIEKAAKRARRPFNYLVSINPEPVAGETTADRKKRISRYPERIRTGLKRRGQPDIAVTAWQWPPDGRLHAHMLVYVAPENDDYMARWAEPPTVHIRQAVPTDIGYITRERLPREPAWEARCGHTRVTGMPLKGRRLSISPDARRLVGFAARKAREIEVPPPVQSPVVWETDARGQFLLFPETPVVDLASFRQGRLPPSVAADLEARRRRMGLTQRQLGELAGLSQPQIANVVAGRFGLSRTAAIRLYEVLGAAA